MPQWFVGVDLGGTQIRAALSNADGHIVRRSSTLTSAEEGPEAVIERILQMIRNVMDEGNQVGVTGIGIGAPGPLDPVSGVVLHAPNLVGWINIPLRDRISREFGIPIILANDANLAALGEHAFGAGRGCSDMIYMTISTGIGGGIISGGKMFVGRHGFAGEIGHQTILVDGPLCGCGNRGCLEALAAGPAIARMGIEAARRGEGTLMLKLAAGTPEEITASVVGEAANRGEATAREIVSRAANYIGIGLANLANMLDPELFVLGGGVTKIGDLLFDGIRAGLRASAMEPVRNVPVTAAVLGDDVVLLGAIEMIRRTLDSGGGA